MCTKMIKAECALTDVCKHTATWASNRQQINPAIWRQPDIGVNQLMRKREHCARTVGDFEMIDLGIQIKAWATVKLEELSRC